MSELMKSRLTFWARLFSWIGVGCGVPIGVFAYKFGLFTQSPILYDELGNAIVTPDISINGWGIISALLVGSFVTSILKEVADAHSGYSLVKQCYVGLCKTIPLIVAYVVFYFLREAIDKVMFCLTVLILCRLVSIPLNPLPQWKYEKQGKESYDTVVDIVTETVKEHLKRGDE